MPRKKNPWIAAILNLVLWGAGYLYVGKRTIFGILVLVSYIASNAAYVVIPESVKSAFHLSSLGVAADVFGVISLLIYIAFAYDGYMAAQEANKRK